MKIIPAEPAHAPLIADAIVMAITPELVAETFGEIGLTTEQAREVFMTLASRPDSQYSYLNTLLAVEGDGSDATVTGLVIGYDGALLAKLRETFLQLLEREYGVTSLRGNLPDECDEGEFYIDTLAVRPPWRRRGIGAALLHAAAARAETIGKPAGLLVDKANPQARRLYESVGFRHVGDRPFFREMMDHMQLRTGD